MEDIWTETLEDNLVDLWQEHECLYKVSAGSYRDRDKKRKSLEEIARALQLNGKL